MPFEVSKLDETPQYVKALIYGDSGVGKTVLASSAPNPLFISVEGGLLSVRQFGRNPDVIAITEFTQIKEVYEHIVNNLDNWDTIVIDSLTELQRRSMEAVMKQVVAQNSRRDPDVPGLGEYGKNGEVIRKVIRRFRDLPKNVIFTCLTLDVTDNDTGLPIARPMLQGKLAAEVPAYMDLVGQLIVRRIPMEGGVEAHRQLNLEHGGRYTAKTRLALPAEILDPDFTEIISKATKKSPDLQVVAGAKK